MRLTLLAISPFVLVLAFLGFGLACAGPGGGGGGDTAGSSGSSSDSCYDQGYQDCADGYAPESTCNGDEYCSGYCDCDGYGDYCADCY